MRPKPDSCVGCALEHKSRGFVPPVGPPASPLLFLGEAAGAREAIEEVPFVGEAGGLLNRALWFLDKDRPSIRIHNLLSCQPPGNWLDGAPWEHTAVAHCARHLDPVLQEGHRVVVTLGAVPTRHMLGIAANEFAIKDFHGTVHWDAARGLWIVPSFHPSHIQRGAFNLFGTFLWDLGVAFELAKTGKYERDPYVLKQDPPVEEFAAWVEVTIEHQDECWLAVDIETPDKERKRDEGELGAKDRSRLITRVNFATGPDAGWTVPFVGPYIALIRRLLASRAVKCFWHEKYDCPRLRDHDCPPEGVVLDFMWAWHVLQSDCPRGLGFVAPFFSNLGAWKHLSDADPVRYAAIDGIQTWRVAKGIAEALQGEGRWETFWRHVYELEARVIQPSERVGILTDPEALERMSLDLNQKAAGFYNELQTLVPEQLLNLKPKDGWKTPPEPEKIAKLNETRKKHDEPALVGAVVEREIATLVKLCAACGEQEVSKKHRCKDAKGKIDKEKTPRVVSETLSVRRWYVREEFNPGSAPQVMGVIKHWKHKPGISRQTRKPSADRLTLERLAKSTKKEEQRRFYHRVMDYRDVEKVRGTYVDGTRKRLERDRAEGRTDNRLSPTVTHKPSTLRLSYTAPNLTNVVADRRGKESLAAGFKKCLVAAPGCKLVSADYSGIEAVNVGWFSGDPDYIKSAWLGVHARLTAQSIGKPADMSWSSEKLVEYFHQIKKEHETSYDRSKRCIHGTSYGLTPYGMHDRFPEIFPTVKVAQQFQDQLYAMAPKMKLWHHTVRELAHEQHYLGGAGAHPVGYKHWFWDVYHYSPINEATAVYRERKGLPWVRLKGKPYKIQLGEDAKRCIAFFPQSAAAGKMKEDALTLWDPEDESYIGDAWFGETPLRAIVHDEFLLEVPDPLIPSVSEKLIRVMGREIKQMPCPEEWGLGPYLRVGVSIKVGQNWGEMKEVASFTPGLGTKSSLAGELGDAVDYDWVGEAEEAEEEYADTWSRHDAGAYAGTEDVPF